MPQISVIVPVYNVETYLHRCVDSILAQTFTDFELILVDDGSPDNCGAICDEYAEQDARIHVIHQPNGGLSAARNAGIDWAFVNSASEWLAFVDSDDWVHPRYLEYLYRAVKENNVKICVCEYEETDALRPVDDSSEYKAKIVDGIGFFASEKNVVATVAWNKLYQKELFSELRYPVGKIHEDEFVTYKLLYATGRIAHVEVTLYYYFVNQQGITRSEYSLKRLNAIEAMEEQSRFFYELGKLECYNYCVSRIIKACPYHVIELGKNEETDRAELLRKRGRRLLVENFALIKKFTTDERDIILAGYFPVLNHVVMPFCNLSRMLKHGGVREAFMYYKRKLKRNQKNLRKDKSANVIIPSIDTGTSESCE